MDSLQLMNMSFKIGHVDFRYLTQEEKKWVWVRRFIDSYRHTEDIEKEIGK